MVRTPCAFTAEGLGSIPGQGAEIPQTARCGKKKKKVLNIKLSYKPAYSRELRQNAYIKVMHDCTLQNHSE